jgi:hypothetical protein
MTPSAIMLRTYLAHDILKLENHVSLTKDKKLRKRLRQVIEMKRKKMESIQ